MNPIKSGTFQINLEFLVADKEIGRIYKDSSRLLEMPQKYPIKKEN